MSYIFDALRKSESERQREVSASLTHAPLARPRQRVPAWTWLVIAALCLALIALAMAWWRSEGGGLAIGSGAASPSLEPASPAARETPPATAQPLDSTAPVAANSRLRPIGELASFDPSLPEYSLDVLAPSSRDPAESSAWINGRRYYPGERIGNGPVVLEVRSNGVVLALAGERFLLTTR